MFRSLIRTITPNPLDALLKKAQKNDTKRVLICWNRGLGDIALGLYAIILRIKTFLPKSTITFLIRKDLADGFTMLKGVDVLIAKNWRRACSYDIEGALQENQFTRKDFDLVIEKPDPTYWVKWQLGKIVPKLSWDKNHDKKHEKFKLDAKILVGIQVAVETKYGLWRNWPLENYQKLFETFQDNPYVKFLLFGQQSDLSFPYSNLIDLRGKTTLFELLSIIKNRCDMVILPDSGILTLTYFLNEQFDLDVISFWGDPRHGILKQNVISPNKRLHHYPLIGKNKDLSTVKPDQVIELVNNLCMKKS